MFILNNYFFKGMAPESAACIFSHTPCTFLFTIDLFDGHNLIVETVYKSLFFCSPVRKDYLLFDILSIIWLVLERIIYVEFSRRLSHMFSILSENRLFMNLSGSFLWHLFFLIILDIFLRLCLWFCGSYLVVRYK